MAVAVGILARHVDVEGMVRVLDQRNAQAALDEQWDQLFDERGLAAAGPARKTESSHAQAVAPPQELPAPAVQPKQWSPHCIGRPIFLPKSKSKILSFCASRPVPPSPASG